MNRCIIEILEKLENEGFEAYVVGGYVRDFLLGKENNDVDICTNALPKEINKIMDIKSECNKYGVINMIYNNYNFDISTYRKEIKYINRKNIDINYITDLKTDLLRRDFTINSICLDKIGNVVDLLDGKTDLKNKKIKLIGDNVRLKEDPLRILRAIRFATILDFSLDLNLEKGIKEYKNYVKDLSKTRIKEEIDKILLSQNYEKGLLLLKKFDLLDILGIQYSKVIFVDDLYGMYAQINLSDNYPFTKKEIENIEKIKEIIKQGYIDNYTIFKYGLYIATVSSKILGISKDEIINRHHNLQIKDKKELDISVIEIKDILKIDFEESKRIEDILVKNVVNNKLINKHEVLVNFIKNGVDTYE